MRGVPLAAALVFATLATGAGGASVREDPASPAGRTAVAERSVRTCRAGSARRLVSPRAAYAAFVRSEALAYRAPGKRPFASFGRLNVNGVPTAFGVLHSIVDRRCRPTWYHVELPMRPNGIAGYVRARNVELGRVTTRIVVDLSQRRVTLFRRGREVLSSIAAVGAPSTPTPTGRYYVNQRLVPAEAGGPYGPGAVGISAFSPVLTGWVQGGPIAIHGTNESWSIGRAVSNGCVRVPNAVARRVFVAALVGTPVVIRA